MLNWIYNTKRCSLNTFIQFNSIFSPLSQCYHLQFSHAFSGSICDSVEIGMKCVVFLLHQFHWIDLVWSNRFCWSSIFYCVVCCNNFFRTCKNIDTFWFCYKMVKFRACIRLLVRLTFNRMSRTTNICLNYFLLIRNNSWIFFSIFSPPLLSLVSSFMPNLLDELVLHSLHRGKTFSTNFVRLHAKYYLIRSLQWQTKMLEPENHTQMESGIAIDAMNGKWIFVHEYDAATTTTTKNERTRKTKMNKVWYMTWGHTLHWLKHEMGNCVLVSISSLTTHTKQKSATISECKSCGIISEECVHVHCVINSLNKVRIFLVIIQEVKCCALFARLLLACTTMSSHIYPTTSSDGFPTMKLKLHDWNFAIYKYFIWTKKLEELWEIIFMDSRKWIHQKSSGALV